MVLLDPLSLVRVGIYKRSLTSQRIVLVGLAERVFASVICAASFEKKGNGREASQRDIQYQCAESMF